MKVTVDLSGLDEFVEEVVERRTRPPLFQGDHQRVVGL